MTTSGTAGHLGHLFYELRMLLGAAYMCDLAEKNRWEHATNYFKDSAYIHIRNLYVFFTDVSSNDISIEDFGVLKFYSDFYQQWREALNRRVMHISQGRPRRNETLEPRGSIQLNEIVKDFVTEIVTMWQIWASLIENADLRRELNSLLTKAKLRAEDDYKKVYTANQ